ncbi:MAG: hypothetical protein V1820_00950 [archaeon]
MLTEEVMKETPLVEFEVDSIEVTEEELPDGFRIHEEGHALGVDIEKHGDKFRYVTHSWDEIRMKLARDVVEGIISEAEIKHDFSGLGRKIAEELGELDCAAK